MTRQYFFRMLFTVVGLALLAGYLFGPSDVADRFDTIALGLLGLAALPWLGTLVEEFKIGGIEAKLRTIREEAQDALETATDAREVAEELVLAKGVSRVESSNNGYEDLSEKELSASPLAAPETVPIPPEKDGDQDAAVPLESSCRPVDDDPFLAVQSGPLDELRNLAEKYVEKRAKMTPGAMRTAMMTNIFADMQGVAMMVDADDGTITGWMKGKDDGLQLAAIAWLRNYPAAMPPSAYIDLIERTTEPFVQYWGLRALSGRISALGSQEISIADRIALKELESLIRPGTDSQVQVRRINRELSR